jgi:peroxiredoxin Q/BCP
MSDATKLVPLIKKKEKAMNTLKVGDKAFAFDALDQDGNRHTLADYSGKKLIVFFYPAASTPGCTAEACNLTDNYTALQNAGYEILGVSADTAAKQKKFKDKYAFPFPLLADTEKSVIQGFGVWGEKKFMGRVYDGIHRMTFLIDEDGVIERVIQKVKTKDHAAQILSE